MKASGLAMNCSRATQEGPALVGLAVGLVFSVCCGNPLPNVAAGFISEIVGVIHSAVPWDGSLIFGNSVESI